MPSIHLTFDDGPGPATRDILRLLKLHDVRASFFVVGKNVVAPDTSEDRRSDTRKIILETIRDGHEIGNHTYSHEFEQSGETFLKDVKRCEAMIREFQEEAGHSRHSPIRVRLPYGIQLQDSRVEHEGLFGIRALALDPRLNLLASIGSAHFHWTNDFDDWKYQEWSNALIGNVERHVDTMLAAGLNPVLLLHDASAADRSIYREATVGVVQHLLARAKEKGWSFFSPSI
jgi:peptidoglycan-N-acetylglucosamine deacetylase